MGVIYSVKKTSIFSSGKVIALSLIHICTMSLRTHQPFESAEKAVKDNLDIISQKNILETENHRILVEDTCLLYTYRCV